MKNLFIITHDANDKPVIYRTPATDELLAKLDKSREFNEYTGFEDSTDLALPLTIGTDIAAFTKVAGDVPLDTVPEAEFLKTMGASGIDSFY